MAGDWTAFSMTPQTFISKKKMNTTQTKQDPFDGIADDGQKLAIAAMKAQTKQAKHTAPCDCDANQDSIATCLRHGAGEWMAKPTAGHDIHGQSVIYDAETGRDIAIVYDGKAHAERIVRAVNSHEELLGACQSALEDFQSGHANVSTYDKLFAAIAHTTGE